MLMTPSPKFWKSKKILKSWGEGSGVVVLRKGKKISKAAYAVLKYAWNTPSQASPVLL